MPLSEALNDIADDMRRAAHQDARRRAARAAPRVSLIVTSLIVPGAMILIIVSMLLGSGLTDSGLLGASAMPERIRSRGPERLRRLAGVGLQADHRRARRRAAADADLAHRRGRPRPASSSCSSWPRRASFFPLRYWDRVGPALVRHPAYLAAEFVLATVILLLTPVGGPVLLLHARHRAARRAAVRAGGRRDLLAAARRRLPVVAERALGRRRRSPTRSRPTSACRRSTRSWRRPAPPRGGCWTARPRRRPSSPPSRAARPRRRSARGWRATCTTRWPRPSRASASPRWRSRAGSSATPRARPTRRAGSPRTRARRRARRARSSPGCARRRASRCRSRPRWRCSRSAGRRRTASSWTSRSRRSASSTRWPRASSSGSSREALRNASATPTRRRSACGCAGSAARAVLTVADDGDGFDAPDDLEELARGRHFGVVGMRERAQLAGGDLSVESAPGEGCVLSVWVPTEVVAARRRACRDEPARRAGADAEPVADAAARPAPCRGTHGSDQRPARRRQRDRPARHREPALARPTASRWSARPATAARRSPSPRETRARRRVPGRPDAGHGRRRGRQARSPSTPRS